MENDKLIFGDCLKEMQKLKPNSIDAIITDPPYGTNYGKVKGDENTKTYQSAFPEMFRILKDKSFLLSYCYPLFVPQIIESARSSGFIYRWIGFNYYPNMFKQKPQPLGYNRYDLFLMFSKGDAKKRGYIKDTIHILMDKKNYKNREGGHPHQKPEKCWEKLIKSTTNEGDVVFDPFMGTGGCLLVAKKMNRKFIGIEIDKEYFDIAKKRIENAKEIQNLDKWM